ncbi:hypothetical protein FRB90_005221, partial [Tulasnella sp. 427]
MTGWMPELDPKGKAVSWSNGHVSKWDKSFDSFVEALKAVYDETKGSRKRRKDLNLVLMFMNAERLKETVPALVVSLTRLRELAQIPVTTIFLSSAPWSEISPPIGTSSEPYMVSITSRSRQDVILYLNSRFPKTVASTSAPQPTSDAYDPILKPLHAIFLGVLYDACTPYTTDPDDLEYLAYAMWPGFVRPILEDWWAEERDRKDEGNNVNGFHDQTGHQDGRCLPPDSATPLLIKQFIVSFQSSFPPLYNRSISATAFLRAQAAQTSFRLSQRFSASAMASIHATLSSSPKKIVSVGLSGSTDGSDLGASLSNRKKLLLVAA